MHNTILAADDLRETSEYVESLSNAPDNTNGQELIKYAAEICRDINREKRSDNNVKSEICSHAASSANVGRSSRGYGSGLCSVDTKHHAANAPTTDTERRNTRSEGRGAQVHY